MCHFYDADPSIETIGLWNVIKKKSNKKKKLSCRWWVLAFQNCSVALPYYSISVKGQQDSILTLESVLLNALAQCARKACASWRASHNNSKIYLGLNLIGHEGQPPPQMTKPWLLLFFSVAFLGSQAFHKLKCWNFLPTREAEIKRTVARELIVTLKGQGLCFSAWQGSAECLCNAGWGRFVMENSTKVVPPSLFPTLELYAEVKL